MENDPSHHGVCIRPFLRNARTDADLKRYDTWYVVSALWIQNWELYIQEANRQTTTNRTGVKTCN